jgi:hypothetical protein
MLARWRRVMGSPNIGDRLTDWSQGITFIVATLGYHAGVPVVACSTTGEIHRLQDCGEPDIRYERALTEEELEVMLFAVVEELSGDAGALLAWLGLLSPPQKRQLWEHLSPDSREAIASLRASQEEAA